MSNYPPSSVSPVRIHADEDERAISRQESRSMNRESPQNRRTEEEGGLELATLGDRHTGGVRVVRDEEEDETSSDIPTVGSSSTVHIHPSHPTSPPSSTTQRKSKKSRPTHVQTHHHHQAHSSGSVESKEDDTIRLPPPPMSSAAAAALADSESESGGGGADDEEKVETIEATETTTASAAPTAADVYARPLLYYKRAAPDRQRRGQAPPAQELGPTQLLLPDGTMALGFPPLKEAARRRRDEPLPGESVVVFTPPNEEQASKLKLWSCILAFLIPADVILICTIYFLGGPVADDESYNSGTSDLVTFICAMIALLLGLLGMKLKDTRLITLFIVVYYVDAIINLIRISSILQLAQFFIQVGVCHCMGHYRSSLIPQWWVADT